MFLTIDINSVQSLVAIIGGVLGILGAISGIYLRYSKKLQDKQATKNKEKQKLNDVFSKVDRMAAQIDDITNSQKELREQYAAFEKKFDHLETQELRYMINDSFLGYDTIHEVPDEQLLNAADCCEIYLNKGLNHATGARCKLIAEEIDRRARAKAGIGDKHGDKK